MLTDAQQREWADGLAPTPRERVATISALLRYAKEDGMTAEDRTVCVRQLQRIAREAQIDVDGVLWVTFKGRHKGHRRRIA